MILWWHCYLEVLLTLDNNEKILFYGILFLITLQSVGVLKGLKTQM